MAVGSLRLPDRVLKEARKRLEFVRVIEIAILATFALAGLAAAKWVYDVRTRGDELGEDEPRGFHKGNRPLWWLFKTIFLLIFGYPNWWQSNIPVVRRVLKRRILLIGWEKFERGLELAGCGSIPISNHDGSASIFLILLALHLTGHPDTAREMVHPIGLRFFNRNVFFSFGVKSVDRLVVVPPTMISSRFPRQTEIAREINNEGLLVVAEVMRQNRVMPYFPEGTRTKAMRKARPGASRMIDHDGVYFLPLAIETSMWDAGKWPNPSGGARLIAGEPVHIDVIRAEAQELHRRFGVAYQRAFTDILMWRVGRLHLEKGDPKYAGYYNIPPEKRYQSEARKSK